MIIFERKSKEIIYVHTLNNHTKKQKKEENKT